MLLASGFYPNPVPGFIVTSIVCTIAASIAIFIAVRNFGPAAKRRAASEAWKAANGPSVTTGTGASPHS